MKRWDLQEVGSSHGRSFEEAYGALAAEFGARGELERREVIERWLDAGQPTYHLLVARDEDGTLAAVRDCHVIVDRGVAVVYLAHALVLPPYRRSGLGALLRRAPIAIAQREAGDAAILLAAEMEHPRLDDEASIIRLCAYGKDGFSAIAPTALPYFQPDFRDLGPEDEPQPIPLVAVVRWLGHEDARALPVHLARAFVTHLYAVFRTHVRADHIAKLETAALAGLGGNEVPLLPLPRSPDDLVPVKALQSR
jgi:GNAT superfamily N-acetyltransferase